MDASAYLQKQGWRGHGHSLDHTDRGIKKPLLVSKKVDVLGVGVNKHQAVSDQWWLRAFDNGLKAFGTGQQSALAVVQKHGVNRGGLYARFIKGEGVPGSIGQSPVTGSEAGTGTSTPVAGQQSTIAVDTPPRDEPERVVGQTDDKNHHDATMHLLQNPGDAPAGMQKMLDKKRKRAERPVEKRARRKVECSEKSQENARDNQQKANDKGRWDKELKEERRQERELNRQAGEYVLEAQRRGVIPIGSNETRKDLVPVGGSTGTGQPTEAFVTIVSQAGLDPHSPYVDSGKQSEKAQKYAREKMKLEVKRAAKTYLTGNKSRSEQTSEERRAQKAEKNAKMAVKNAAAAEQDAERVASREQKAERKRRRRAEKKVEKGKSIKAKMEALGDSGKAGNAGKVRGDGQSLNGTHIENSADEVKLGINSKGTSKKISGVGTVERHPTKGEKKAKKLMASAIKEGLSEEEIKRRTADEQAQKAVDEQVKIDKYRAMQQGMSPEEYRKSSKKGQVQTPKIEKKTLPPEKLAEYEERARLKGVTLEQYIERRDEKYAVKQAEKLGKPSQSETTNAAKDGKRAAPRKKPAEDASATKDGMSAPDDDEELGFIVDTAGDDSLAVKPMRKARQQWVKAHREEREAREPEDKDKASKPAKKAKGERKIEARESFVKQILFHSRKSFDSDDKPNGVTIDGVTNVPLVKVQSSDGSFKQEEVALARTVARRALRNVKREEKAKKGKGKEWKKRERAEREAAKSAGIKGATDGGV